LFLVHFGGGIPLAALPVCVAIIASSRDREDAMKEPREKQTRRIGRKDLQDPDRDVRTPREGGVDREPERSDRDAGAGRPVQLDEEGRSRRADSPRPSEGQETPK
jgi:hypothetical protein